MLWFARHFCKCYFNPYQQSCEGVYLERKVANAVSEIWWAHLAQKKSYFFPRCNLPFVKMDIKNLPLSHVVSILMTPTKWEGGGFYQRESQSSLGSGIRDGSGCACFSSVIRKASLQGTSTCGRVYSLNTLLRLPASWPSELLIPQGPFCRLLLYGDLSSSCRVAYNTQNAQLPSNLFSSLIISHLLPSLSLPQLSVSPLFWARTCWRVFAWAVLFKCSALRKWHLVHVFI